MGSVTNDERERRRELSDGMRVLAQLEQLPISLPQIAALAGISLPELWSVTTGNLHDVEVKKAVATVLGTPWTELWPGSADLPTDPTIGPKLKLSPEQWRQYLHLEPVTDLAGITAAIALFHAETEAFRAQNSDSAVVAPAIETTAFPDPERVKDRYMAITPIGEEFGIVRTAMGFVLADGTIVKRQSQAVNWFRERGALIVALPEHRVEEFRRQSYDVFRYFAATRRFQVAIKEYEDRLQAFVSTRNLDKFTPIRDETVQAYEAAFADILGALPKTEAGKREAESLRERALADRNFTVLGPRNTVAVVRHPLPWALMAWHGDKPHLLIRIGR